jgi:hypothetical protein
MTKQAWETPKPILRFEQRFAYVELQYLALNLDGPDENPDLIGSEPMRIAAGQRFEFFGHRCMLVGGGLQAEPHFAPGGRQLLIVVEPLDIAGRVREKEAETSHIARIGVGLQ